MIEGQILSGGLQNEVKNENARCSDKICKFTVLCLGHSGLCHCPSRYPMALLVVLN